MRELLKHIQHRYGGVPIYITENGMSDHGGSLDDTERVLYYRLYINQVLKGEQFSCFHLETPIVPDNSSYQNNYPTV